MTREGFQEIYERAHDAQRKAFERRQAGDLQGAILLVRESVECWRTLDRVLPAHVHVLGGLVQALISKGALVSEGGLFEDALTATEEVVAMLRALPEAERQAFLPDLAMSLNNLAVALSDLGRREEALAPAEEAVGFYRNLAQAEPQAYLPHLAQSLAILANIYGDLGRCEAALVPGQEAVGIWRAQAQAQPQAFLPDLAKSLTTLTNRLSDLGRREEALAPAEEAVGIYRNLAQAEPQAFLSYLAMSFNNLTNRLSSLGRREEALAPAEEAVGIYRDLAKARPQLFLTPLAVSLNTLASVLSDLGRCEESLALAKEAVGIRRAQAQAQPQAFLSYLAKSLNNLSNHLGDLGQRIEALAPAEEAVGILRGLAKLQPQAFLPNLALSLNTLTIRLDELGRSEEAIAPAEEAVGIFRGLAQAQPQAFLSDLARSLNTLVNVLIDLGRREEAIAPAEEAVGIFRGLAQAQPQAFLSDLARSLSTLADVLIDLGRHKEALVPAEEAVAIRRALTESQPQAFLPRLASALITLANVFSHLGRREEALAPAAEAVGIYRAQVQAQPEAFLPCLATTLSNLAAFLGGLGRREEAIAHAEEALWIRRALARAQPRAFLADLATSLNNLAHACVDLGRHEEALVSVNEALILYPQLPPAIQKTVTLAKAKTHWNLARIHLSAPAPPLRDLPKAFDALQDAVYCIEEYRGSFRDEAHRRRVISETIPIYESMIHSAIELWESFQDQDALRKALWAAEGVRQRQMLDRLRAEVLEPDAPEEVRQEWRHCFEQLEAAERALDSFDRDGTDYQRPRLQRARPSSTADSPFSRSSSASRKTETCREALTARRDEMEARHKRVLEMARRFDPDFDPYQPLPRAGLDDARRLLDTLPGTVLVEYVVTESSGYALLVHGERVHPVRLPTLTTGEVQAMGMIWLEGYGDGKLESWGFGLRANLAALAPQVLWPVLDALGKLSAREGFKPEGLILCPHQYLNLLPFHAMPVDLGGDELLIDRFEVSYASSLSMLKHAARRRPGSGKTCLIGDPKGDLRFIEAVTLAYRRAHPEAEVIHGEEGTVGAFLQRGGQMQRAEIWAHMGGSEDPMDAGIQFARGEVLRLHQIYRELRLRLRPHLVLNGCESGLMSPVRSPGTERKGKDPGNVYLTDFDGLPMGFLFAGARSVVSTLWTVYDLSAALLMDRYHHELKEIDASPAGALRRASQWLRKKIRNGEDLRKVGEDLLSRVPPKWTRENADRIEHCRRVLAERAEEHPDDPPFAEPLHWASHYVTGWSWGAVVEGWDASSGLKN